MFRDERGCNVRLIIKMADHPEVVHGIPRGRCLGVNFVLDDLHRGLVGYLNQILAEYRYAKSLFRKEAIVVNLRLRMMVRWVADHFPGR